MNAGIPQRLNRFQKLKTIVILIYFILNAFLLILAFQMDINDLKFLVRVARYIPYFRYIASANMLLIIIVISMHYIQLRKLIRRNREAEQEVVNIKSRLFDMENEKKEMIKKSTQGKML
jgi:hypothetical protein